jgi:hypothetical protein
VPFCRRRSIGPFGLEYPSAWKGSGMSDRLSYQEMADIMTGSAYWLEDFIEKHRRMKPARPEHWFSQQERELKARKQAAEDYRTAAERKRQ